MNTMHPSRKPCDPKTQTVVLLGEEGILSWTVESILNTRAGWCVVRVDTQAGWCGLLRAIQDSGADVVILYHFDTAENARLALDLMGEYPDIKVIAVNPQENEMHVYSRQLVCVNQVADLISVVEQ